MFSDRYRPVAIALTAFAALSVVAVACVYVLSSSTNVQRPTPKTEPYAAQPAAQPRPRSAAGREVVLVRSLPPSPESDRYRISDVAPP